MPDSLPAPIPVIVEAVERLLAEMGPLTTEQLLDALDETGVALGSGPEDLLEDLLESADVPLVLTLTDERQVLLSALLDSRVFTHRLQVSEIEYDLLAIDPDLSPVSMLTEAEQYERLTDGRPVIDVLPAYDAELLDEQGIPVDAVPLDGAFLLPPGTLRALGVREGDLVGLRVTPGGFGIERIDDVADPPTDLGVRIATILADDAPDEPDQLDVVLWTACADDDELFRTPLLPIGELLDAFELPHEGDQVAAAGFDFAAWRVQGSIESVADLYELDEDEALAVLVIVTMYATVAELFDAAVTGGPAEMERLHTNIQTTPMVQKLLPLADVGTAGRGEMSSAAAAGREDARLAGRATLALLREPAVAEAVLAETIDAADAPGGALGLFAETLEPMAPRSARPALRWLRAKAYERIGDTEQAEATLREAEQLDTGWPLTLRDLARYASDRGDAERGLSLLRRAGAGSDDPLVEVLQRFGGKPRTDIGRNHPCWCGSGRKYKQCHLHREQLPLAERAAWLYQKAGMWLLDGPGRDAVLETASARARYWDSPGALIAACQEGLVCDAVLFEGGLFAEFVAVRGVLLPEDERLLAEQWLLVERSVFEIEAVQPGRGITVRDLRTGDRHYVREMAGSRHLKTGSLVCTRVVPAGDTMQSFGGIEPVALHEREELIALLDSAPGPVELVGFLSRRFAPPQISNTEGDPIVLCEATLRIPDPEAIIAALDGTYDRDEDDEPQWTEHVTTHGMERIRATLRLTEGELHVHTNSEARLDRVIATLRRLQPAVTVTGESRLPADELEDSPLGTTGPSAEDVIDTSDPEIVALLGRMAHQYEVAWLDEPIPALAGHTPRQAAADPTRRPDLIKLIDSFPEDDRVGAMNPSRLRAALGLA